MKLLKDVLVLDFSQYIAGPWASVKLGELGARVIKIEKSSGGDNSRRYILSKTIIDGDSTTFHPTNKNKESYKINYHNKNEVERIKKLILKADVMVENFRPGIMKEIGLGYEEIRKINPRIIYVSVSGYGREETLAKKPGQDLLVQSISGLAWASGNKSDYPIPIGIPVVDMFTAMNAVEGILAALFKRDREGSGSKIEVSLLETAIDLQFEELTHFLCGKKLQERSKINNAGGFIPAPTGIYKTQNSYIAIFGDSVPKLGEILGLSELKNYSDEIKWFIERDEIKEVLKKTFKTKLTEEWLKILTNSDFAAVEVMTYKKLLEKEGANKDFFEIVFRENGTVIKTTRSGLKINGCRVSSKSAAPIFDKNTELINKEFNL